MSNKPGRAWHFPDFGNDAEKLAMAKVRIGWLEDENQKLRDELERLKDIFASMGVPSERYEILDAEIVEDLDNGE